MVVLVMDKQDEVATLLGVEQDVLNGFSTSDPFNPPNTFSGFICRQSDYRYGTMVLTEVNGKTLSVPQVVYGSPKLDYPFSTTPDGRRLYRWPVCNRVKVYEKWDGTNVLCFSYADVDGNRYVSYKTRLSPILRHDSKFGDFYGMWKEVLSRYPFLGRPEQVLSGRYAYSYEMFGYRNQILVYYPVALEARMIFKVEQVSATILPPEEDEEGDEFRQLYNPVMANVGGSGLSEFAVRGGLSELYEAMREQAHSKVVVDSEGGISGTEGVVVYVLTAGLWKLYKCKPEEIENIHWSSDVIGFNSILTTARNALENVSVDELTNEFVVGLLKEEFSDVQIEKSQERIHKAIAQVREHGYMLIHLREMYDASPMECHGEKRLLMRYMSQFFKKQDMRKVFGGLKELNLVT